MSEGVEARQTGAIGRILLLSSVRGGGCQFRISWTTFSEQGAGGSSSKAEQALEIGPFSPGSWLGRHVVQNHSLRREGPWRGRQVEVQFRS